MTFSVPKLCCTYIRHIGPILLFYYFLILIYGFPTIVVAQASIPLAASQLFPRVSPWILSGSFLNLLSLPFTSLSSLISPFRLFSTVLLCCLFFFCFVFFGLDVAAKLWDWLFPMFLPVELEYFFQGLLEDLDVVIDQSAFLKAFLTHDADEC